MKKPYKKWMIGLLVVLFVFLPIYVEALSSELLMGSVTAEGEIGSLFKKFEMLMGTVFTLYTIFIALVIFMENRNPSKTIAWLLILFLVPVVGFIFYLFLGQNFRKRNIFKKKRDIDFEKFQDIAKHQRQAIKDRDLFKDDESFVKKRLISLILNNANAPFTVNNRSKILTNGKETFEEITEALKTARHHIHLEYFIIKEDGIGSVVKRILIEKAQSGVMVRLIYDSVGSWRLSKAYLEELNKAGIEVYSFLPVYFPIMSRELNYRNHRKIIVVDGKTGFLGGLNIGDEYLGGNAHLGFWRDTHLQIEGEAVYGLQNIFFKDWHFVSKQRLPYDEVFFPKLPYYGEQLIQIAASGPDSDWQSIMQAYFATISSAEDRIWINTPYLVPDESIMMALRTAALSGVDVRIVLPSYPDHHMVYWASMSNIEELLQAGVRIYKYTKGFMHGKILLVDGIAASIGTANLDIRSFQINFEVNAFVYDKEVVARMEQDFYMDIEDSKEVILEEYLKRPMLEKIKEATGRLMSPLL